MITVTQELYDISKNHYVYTVKVPIADVRDIKLDRWDQAVINSPSETAADILQSLQILAFRQSQQMKSTEEDNTVLSSNHNQERAT